MFRVLGLYGRFRRQGNLEYELRVFLKGGQAPPPLQTHPHTHTMREKRRFNGALRILSVFHGRASQPTSQWGGGGGGGGGFQSLPATQPRLGAAPMRGHPFDSSGWRWKAFSEWRHTHNPPPPQHNEVIQSVAKCAKVC